MSADWTRNPLNAAGMPTGEVGEQVHRLLAEHLLDEADAAGWDQAASLHAVMSAGLGPSPAAGTDAAPGQEHSSSGLRQVGYAVEHVGMVHGHPRHALPGLRLPDEVLEVALVAEAWRSPDPDRATLLGLRPSQDPERIETRTVTFVDRSGLVRGYRRDRDSSALVEDSPVGATMLSGRIPQLLARTLGVDIPERMPVRSALGRFVLARCAAFARAGGLSGQEGARLVLMEALRTVGGVMDGLESPWELSLDIPNLGAVFVQGHWCLVAGGLALEDQPETSQFAREASAIANVTWADFWQAPGAVRWCYRDEADKAMTDDLWDWYGSGLRVGLVDDRLQQSSDALESLRGLLGPDGYPLVGDVLTLLDSLGWDPFAEFTPLDPASAA